MYVFIEKQDRLSLNYSLYPISSGAVETGEGYVPQERG